MFGNVQVATTPAAAQVAGLDVTNENESPAGSGVVNVSFADGLVSELWS
jgi:prepilin-type processing-associated H-X9-DG protein